MQQISDTVQFYDAVAPTYDDISGERSEYIDAVNNEVAQELFRRKASEVMDVGCGNGVRSLDIASKANIKGMHGIDISKGMISEARKRGLDAAFGNIVEIETIPTELIGTMDAVTCLWNVLGHIPDVIYRRQAVANMARLLRPGGALIIDVNNRYNVPSYGILPVMRNIGVDMRHPRTPHGDFTTTKATSCGEITTQTHIFSPQEILRLMILNKLMLHNLRFINYNNGVVRHNPFAGQIFTVATKKKRTS